MEKNKPFRRVLIGVAAALTILLLGCTFLSRTIYRGLVPVVQVVAPRSGTLSLGVSAKGTAVYLDQHAVTAKTSWTVVEVFSAAGQFIRAGAPLFSIDIRPLELTRLRLVYELAEAERAERAAPEGEKENIAALCKLLAAELAQHIDSYPADGVVTAPADGTLLSLLAAPGAVLAPGDKAALWAESGAKLYMETALPFAQGKPFSLGDGANVTYLENRGDKGAQYIQKKVYLRVIEQEGETGGLRLYFPVEGESLEAGEEGSVKMTTSLGSFAVIVPLKAVRMTGETEGFALFAATRDGLFGKETYCDFIAVKLLAQNEESAAIETQGVLPPDAEFILTTNRALKIGDAVWIKR